MSAPLSYRWELHMVGEHCSECYRFFGLEFDDRSKAELGEKTCKELAKNFGWCKACEMVVSRDSPIYIDDDNICENVLM